MTDEPKTILPVPAPGSRRPSLHVLRRLDGSTSFVGWSQGKWVFWIGHKRCGRKSPAETATYGWQYVRPAIITETGKAS